MTKLQDSVQQFLDGLDTSKDEKSLKVDIDTYLIGLQDGLCSCLDDADYSVAMQGVSHIIDEFMGDARKGYIHCGKNAGG